MMSNAVGYYKCIEIFCIVCFVTPNENSFILDFLSI